MPEPASSRAPSKANGDRSDPNDIKLQELRELVFGPELDQIDRLSRRLDDPEQRADDWSRILPLAKVRRSFEQSIKTILKSEPDLVMEAIRPVLLLAVRKAVTDALREFTESLNQIAEKSLSLRSLRWRWEAARTGKKFSDIMLSRSLLYSVREVFLIHAKTGILLNQAGREAVAKDPDMISSMFTAIQEFVRDSFIGLQETELDTIDTGAFKLWIQHSPHALIAGAVDGTPPIELRAIFRKALDDIQKKLGTELLAFDGDTAPFEPAHPILEQCLLGKSATQAKNKPILLWVVAALCLAAIGSWAYFSIVNHQRWNTFVVRLEKEPGIVITRTDKQPPGHVVSGFRDPLATAPAALLPGTGIAPADVVFRLEPYESLAPAFVARRRFEQARQAIDKVVLRFSQGKADLSETDLDRLDEEIAPLIISSLNAAHNIAAHPAIQVTGHTDDLGSGESNLALSSERASRVAAALIAAGVPAAVVNSRGVGVAEPVRQVRSDRDRSFNRSVTLQIVAR